MRSFFMPAILANLLIFSTVFAYETPRVQDQKKPSLGWGYHSDTGEVLPKRVGGDLAYSGSSRGEWKMSNDMSSQEKLLLISGGAEVSLSFSLFTASGGLDINYINKKSNNSISQTLHYDVVGREAQLQSVKILDAYQHVLGRIDANSILGDSYVDTVSLGGRLIIDITVTFEETSDSVGVKGEVAVEVMNLVKGKAHGEVKSTDIASNARVDVRVKQVGGDPTKISKLFGDGREMMSCAGGEYKKCTDLIRQVIDYSSEFGEQLNSLRYDPSDTNGPSIMGFTTNKYINEGIDVLPRDNPLENAENKRKQQRLTNEYIDMIEDIKFIEERLDNYMMAEELLEARDTIEQNISALVDAIQISAQYPNQTSEQYVQYMENKIPYDDPEDIVNTLRSAFKPDLDRLLDCVKCNDIDEAFAILQTGAIDLLTQFDAKGFSPFHRAIENGFDKMLGMLIEANRLKKDQKKNLIYAPVNNARKYNPLCLAAKGGTYGHARCIDVLMDAGARVNGKTSKGQTPVQVAALHGKPLTTKKLMRCGATLSPNQVSGETLLHLAARSGNVETLKYLLENHNLDINAKDKNRLTALHLAAREGNPRAFRFLLDAGADRDAKDDDGKTAIYYGLKQLDFACEFLRSHELPMGPISLGGYPVHFKPKPFSGDGARFVTSDKGVNDIWDTRSGSLIRTINLNLNHVGVQACLNADGSMLAVCYWKSGVEVWDVNSGVLLHELEGEGKWCFNLAFSPTSSTLLACASDGGKVELWNAETAEHLRTVDHSKRNMSLRFSGDGARIIATCGTRLKILDANTGRLIGSGRMNASRTGVINHEGSKIAFIDCNQIKIWDIHAESTHTQFTFRRGVLNCYSYLSPDASCILTFWARGLRIFNAGTGALIHEINSEHKIDPFMGRGFFSPDGSMFALNLDGSGSKIWRLRWNSILHDAVMAGNLAVVEMICEKFPLLPYIRTPQGESPLDIANELSIEQGDDGSSESQAIADYLAALTTKE